MIDYIENKYNEKLNKKIKQNYGHTDQKAFLEALKIVMGYSYENNEVQNKAAENGEYAYFAISAALAEKAAMEMPTEDVEELDSALSLFTSISASPEFMENVAASCVVISPSSIPEIINKAFFMLSIVGDKLSALKLAIAGLGLSDVFTQNIANLNK